MTSTITPLSAPETTAPAPERQQPTSSRPPRRRGWAVAGGLVALAAVVGIGLAVADQGTGSDPAPTPSASSVPATGGPASWFDGPATSYGSVDAMERSLAGDVGDAEGPSAPVGSPDAVERWTAAAAPEAEQPTTVRPF